MVPGDDLRLDLSVPFKTSIFGAEEKVEREGGREGGREG